MTLPPLFLSVWLERTWLGLRFFRFQKITNIVKNCDKISRDDDDGCDQISHDGSGCSNLILKFSFQLIFLNYSNKYIIRLNTFAHTGLSRTPQDDDLGELPRNPCLSPPPLQLQLHPVSQGQDCY